MGGFAGEYAVKYFKKFLPPQAQFVKLTEAKADKMVEKQQKVVLQFGLSAAEWTAFGVHFNGKNCNKPFGPGHVPKQKIQPNVGSGHTVVLEKPDVTPLKGVLRRVTVSLSCQILY